MTIRANAGHFLGTPLTKEQIKPVQTGTHNNLCHAEARSISTDISAQKIIHFRLGMTE